MKNDFNEKWYFIGSLIGLLAGMTLGYIIFG